MRPHEFAKAVGVSVETLRRWDRTGRQKSEKNTKQSSLLHRRRFGLRKRFKTRSREPIYCGLLSRLISETEVRISQSKERNGAILLGKRVCGR